MKNNYKNEVYNVKITNLEYGFSFDIPSNFLEVGEESFKKLELKDNTLYSFSIDDYTNFHVILMSLKEDNIDPLAFRLTCLQSHYRSQLILDYEELRKNVTLLNKIRNKVKLLKEDNILEKDNYKRYLDQFKDAINNDLNTSLMLKAMYDVLKTSISNSEKIYLLKEFDKVLSLDLFKEDEIDNLDEIKNYKSKVISDNKNEILNNDEETSNFGQNGVKIYYAKKQSRKSGKELGNDYPGWSDYEPPEDNEDQEAYLKRILDKKYGKRNWKRGPKSDYNQIKKAIERGGHKAWNAKK